MPKRLAALLLVSGLFLGVAATADGIVRTASPGFPIAASVLVPAGAKVLFVSGNLADVARPDAPAGSVERLGDTETQVRSVLAKLDAQLRAAGFSMGDVVKMNVFLVGDPAKGGRMDFEGLMKAYSERFGSAAQPSLPARTTVQVAALPLPGALVEIELIAAKE